MSTTSTNSIDALVARDAATLAVRHTTICDGCGQHMRFSSQVWGCVDCGRARGWGLESPWDSRANPALNCQKCDKVTRHAFLGVVGRTI